MDSIRKKAILDELTAWRNDFLKRAETVGDKAKEALLQTADQWLLPAIRSIEAVTADDISICPKCGSPRIGQFDNDGEQYGEYRAVNMLSVYEGTDYRTDDDGFVKQPRWLDFPDFSIVVNVCHACRFMWNPDYKEPE